MIKRGKLTNHKVFGEATAILAYDALLTHAFYSVVQASRRHGIPAEQVLSIVEDLAEMAIRAAWSAARLPIWRVSRG